MSKIILNHLRVGNFTSSEIHRLMATAKKAETYIAEKNYERKLGRSIKAEADARPLTWGTLCERRVLETLLDTKYRPLGTDTVQHPNIDYWCGSPDGEKFEDNDVKVCPELKSPYTLKSFCELVEIDTPEKFKAENPEYYWQTLSNCIITGTDIAELVTYCPYESELAEIRDLANNWDDGDQNRFSWIQWADNDHLPYLIEGGHYRNMNVFRFEIPKADKEELISTVLKYGTLLNPAKKV